MPSTTKSPSVRSKTKSSKGSQISAKLSPPRLFKEYDGIGVKDPVKSSTLEEELQLAAQNLTIKQQEQPKKPKERSLTPDVKKRIALAVPVDPVFPRAPFVRPESRKTRKAKAERRLAAELDRNFCKWEKINLAQPCEVQTIGTAVKNPSPDISKTKITTVPRKPSASVTEGRPETPDTLKLKERKPKSGIYINRKQLPKMYDAKDSFDLVYERQPRPRRPGDVDEKVPKRNKKEALAAQKPLGAQEPGATFKESEVVRAIIADEMDKGEGEDQTSDAGLKKMFRRKVSQSSVATSVNSKELAEFPVFDEEDLEEEPQMTRIVQKFRRDSEAERYKPPPRKIVRGTLESHSFTKIEQPVLKEFYYGITLGSVNQYDVHFPVSVRGLQGICIPVAAYCYSMLLHPNKWTELVIDDILEIGTKLYSDSAAMLHMHNNNNELQFFELYKFCFIETKKVHFQVYQPEVVGQVRSTNRKIYNIYQGLQIFFNRQRAGIIKSHGLNVVVWKDKHYYFFDAKGRKKDLHSNLSGPALLAHVYDLPDLCTILLEYTDLGNRPFTISKINVTKVMDKDDPEEDESYCVLPDRSDYNIINEHKAVVQGSFDLSDLCFDFARNKQAVAMATVCLVYSRITPPSSWHAKTVDKIMIIGNQLYLELVESEEVVEMGLEHIPATFTIGPYVVEILIYSNVYADVMARKGASMLQKSLDKFFATNTMAMVFIGKFTIAIWMQRNIYYCFDPYSRNKEGLKCRNGAACVSMHATIESVARTCGINFDNADDIFYLHALKVLKIHRDPAQEQRFPKTLNMEEASPESFKECRIKKGKKKAVQKPVTGDFTDGAVKPLPPWEYLDKSVIEVDSTVDSLTPNQLPPMVHKFPSKVVLRAQVLVTPAKPIDLDSPSLSDTQIEPDRPEPTKDDYQLDLTSWELTQEELELQAVGEGEDEESGLEAYMVMNQSAQVHADSFGADYRKMSAEVNTDLTVGFLPVPREILPPTSVHWKQKMLKEKEFAKRRQLLTMEGALAQPVVTQSMELAKDSNFIDLPDNTQLVRGSENIAACGDHIEYMAPFICMMASAVAQKYAIISWSMEIINYTLRSGAKLYSLAKVRYDQVPILDVPKVSLGQSNYSILVEYLHDAHLQQPVLEEALIKVLFKKHECGLVATPSYACAVFYKNHLYYLFDCFGCNEVGLAEGLGNTGVACLARFKNVQDLVRRVIYNKTKRNTAEEYEFSRFVLSACTSKSIPPKPRKYPKTRRDGEDGEDGSDEEKVEPTVHPLRENRVGYQLNDGMLTLQGSTALKGRATVKRGHLKADHFVCICACLMQLNYPILKWDTKRVDYVIEQGNHIYDHAENLSISEKRIIRNILIYQHFFDIIITWIKLPEYMKNLNLLTGLACIARKRNYVLLQFPNCCYLMYKHNTYYHLFDPYPCLPNGMQDMEERGNAGWTIFNNVHEMRARIGSQVVKRCEHFTFYTFEVTSVSKAPKSLIVAQNLLEYELGDKITPEKIGAPFNERDVWLLKDPVPWSRIKSYSAKDRPRGKSENMWHNWDIEYPNDLFSLVGTFHQKSEKFSEETRGKQTLANLIVAIGMSDIYPFAQWTSSILDSILNNGNDYFKECVDMITDDDHEFDTDDLQPNCTIYPFTFEVTLVPIVDGTMFLMRSSQFNLYKALRLFFDGYDNRKGIIWCDQGAIEKRFVAFGKIKENEYFMFDCQISGPPMFIEHRGVSYILRCKTLKRLLYVLTLTLRGGDFFIFEVDLGNFKSKL